MARITTGLLGIFALILSINLTTTVSGAPNPAPAPLGPPETNPARPNKIDNSIHISNPNVHVHVHPFQSTMYPRLSFSSNGSNATNSTNSNSTSPSQETGKEKGKGNQPTHYHYCDPGDPPINALSPASPLISDCLALIADIDNHEWSYKWISCKQHALVSHGTCVFGIETVPDDLCYPWTTLETGNGDIIDWINASISTWGETEKGDEGRVGTWGTSQCHNTGWWRDDYLDVKWGVYHSA